MVIEYDYPNVLVVQVSAFSDNYLYLLHDKSTGHTAAIDPGDATPIESELETRGWDLQCILNTHHHWDHVNGNSSLSKTFAAPVLRQSHSLGDTEIVAMSVPGHTLDHLAYHLPKDNLLFCGDTVFSMGCGRLFEGTPEQMFHSLQKISRLPGQTQIFCAHEYTLENGRFAASLQERDRDLLSYIDRAQKTRDLGRPTVPCLLADELRFNPFLRAPDVQTFAQVRSLKDSFS